MTATTTKKEFEDMLKKHIKPLQDGMSEGFSTTSKQIDRNYKQATEIKNLTETAIYQQNLPSFSRSLIFSFVGGIIIGIIINESMIYLLSGLMLLVTLIAMYSYSPSLLKNPFKH